MIPCDGDHDCPDGIRIMRHKLSGWSLIGIYTFKFRNAA